MDEQIFKKWFLRFKNEELEEAYQNQRRKKTYSQYKKFNVILSICCLITLFLLFLIGHLKGNYINDDYECYKIRDSFILVFLVPTLVGMFQLETIFMKFSKTYIAEVGGIPTILVLLVILVEFNIYRFPHFVTPTMSFTTLSFTILGILYISTETTVHWERASLGCFFGFLYVVIRYMIHGQRGIIEFCIPFMLTMLFTSLFYSFEKSERQGFYLLESAKKREKEWERVLTSMSQGFIIHEKQKPNLDGEQSPRMPSDRSPEIKFSNPALKKMLQENALEEEMSNEISSRSENLVYINGRNVVEEIKKEEERLNIFVKALYRVRCKDDDDMESGKDENIGIMEYETESGNLELRIERIDIMFRGCECVGIIIDNLTIHNRQERERLTNEFQSRMVHTITHEIRTPLNLISGSIEILETHLEGKIKEEQSLYVKNIKVGIRCLIEFVESMLKLSYYKSNQQIDLQFKEFDINGLLQDFIQLFQLEIDRKRIDLELIIQEDFPKCIKQDPSAISQLLFILVSNSVKYTFHGSISVNIKFDYELMDINIEVRDTGIGIPDELQKHLFKLYGDTYSKNEEFGIGVGLTLCQALVNSMKGQIFIESTEGEGTSVFIIIPAEFIMEFEEDKFLEGGFINIEEGRLNTLGRYTPTGFLTSQRMNRRVFMPEIPANILPTVSRSDIEEEEKCKGDCPQILIVDDAQSNIFVLKGLLKILNLKADEAMNGLQALEKVKAATLYRKCCGNYTLIFMDCNMPIMDGYEATSKIRQFLRENNNSFCYIVAVTAYNSHENETKCHDCGMDYVKTKPISRNDIINLFANFNIFTNYINN